MAFDHTLRSEEALDLVSELDNILILLWDMSVRGSNPAPPHGKAHPQPIGALGTEAQALETKTNTSRTETLIIRLFVAFLE